MFHLTEPTELGRALQGARQNLGLTQASLALAAGVGVRFVVDLEAGKPTVRLSHVLKVMNALGGELWFKAFDETEALWDVPHAP
ncbi:type II toxin-antitoxin system Y4mF family antitoxin [Pseudomonas sp. NPDC007930]|uniref:helix-turn-helix transcriptional regulator n=1 Tax=Pseudomonas sp. NPDC007930 TaxID=3364417 RepID=UPI0036F08A9D